jgi:hypothetical protein
MWFERCKHLPDNPSCECDLEAQLRFETVPDQMKEILQPDLVPQPRIVVDFGRGQDTI